MGVTPEMLKDVGVLVIPGSLAAKSCETLVAALLADPGEPTAPYSADTMAREHDPQFANSWTTFGTPEMREPVDEAVGGVLPRLERFWKRPLELNPELHFLTYETGGYIRPHKDIVEPAADPGGGPSDVTVLEKIRERVVVFSIFLNEDFEGGEFTLLPGFPVPPTPLPPDCARPGTMVAFSAGLAHSVRTVTAGTRHSVTGWLRAPERERDQPAKGGERP
jgi:predicted 2-oxoglutarate/Fe(II)-dependent dioxygenase YbiX